MTKKVAHSGRPRFFCPLGEKIHKIGDLVELSSADSHHAKDVLRLKVGEAIEICSRSDGALLSCRIAKLDQIVSAEILEISPADSDSDLDIVLICALLKGDKSELVCDWACELGASQIIKFQSERSIVRLKDSEEVEKRQAKFKQRIEAAAKQSHRNKIPECQVFTDLPSALRITISSNHKIYGSLGSEALPLNSIFKADPPHGKVVVAIGPEGDFSDRELSLLKDSGFVPASFGNTVLRAELAAVTGVVAVKLLKN